MSEEDSNRNHCTNGRCMETGLPRNWIEMASEVFAGSRNMTAEEAAEFEALKATLTKPLDKPLKKDWPHRADVASGARDL